MTRKTAKKRKHVTITSSFDTGSATSSWFDQQYQRFSSDLRRIQTLLHATKKDNVNGSVQLNVLQARKYEVQQKLDRITRQRRVQEQTTALEPPQTKTQTKRFKGDTNKTASSYVPQQSGSCRPLDYQCAPRAYAHRARGRRMEVVHTHEPVLNVEQLRNHILMQQTVPTVSLGDLEQCTARLPRQGGGTFVCHGQMYYTEGLRTCEDCGNTVAFTSRVMESKPEEFKNHGSKKSKQAIQHLSKFLKQFQTNYPCITQDPELTERLCTAYYTVHVPCKIKVNPNLTKKFIYENSTSRVYRRAPERVSMELMGDLVPEFTHDQIKRILDDRFQIYLVETQEGETSKNFSNHTIINELSRVNAFPQGRIFRNAKTNTISTERHMEFARCARKCQHPLGETKFTS